MRQNKSIILFLLTLFLTVGCSNTEDVTTIFNSEDSAAEQSIPDDYFLGQFKEVKGTTFLAASIRSAGENSTIRLSSSGGASQTHNYVYLDLEDETLNRLLPDDKSVISDVTGHSRFASDLEQDQEKIGIDWWIYTVIKTDSDDDGYLAYGDLFAVGVADAGGQNYTELLDDVEHIYGQEMKSPSQLLIIYLKENKRLISRIDLPNRTVEDTWEISVFEAELEAE